jgi:hypothetical protein
METLNCNDNTTCYEENSDNIHYSIGEELINYIGTPINILFALYVLFKQIKHRHKYW